MRRGRGSQYKRTAVRNALIAEMLWYRNRSRWNWPMLPFAVSYRDRKRIAHHSPKKIGFSYQMEISRMGESNRFRFKGLVRAGRMGEMRTTKAQKQKRFAGIERTKVDRFL